MIVGMQNQVVVDSHAMERGIKSGMGKGECSANLDNVNALIYIFAPQLWGNLYNRNNFLPFYVASSITLLSYIPFYLGLKAAEHEDAAHHEQQ